MLISYEMNKSSNEFIINIFKLYIRIKSNNKKKRIPTFIIIAKNCINWAIVSQFIFSN